MPELQGQRRQVNLTTLAARENWAVKKSAVLRVRLAEIAHGGPTENVTPLADAVAAYLAECRRERKAPLTWHAGYRTVAAALKRITSAEWFINHRLDTIEEIANAAH